MSINSTKTREYLSVNDIDSVTLDYLQYVMPVNVYTAPIEDVNRFLNQLEAIYAELDENKELQVA